MYLRKILLNIASSIFVAGLIVFVIFQITPLLSGPKVISLTPEHGATLPLPVTTIEGFGERIRHVMINNNDVTLFEDGHFSYTTALAPGINHFTIRVEDKHGRAKVFERDFFHTMEG